MGYWDRITLKTRAKAVLKNTYWMTFLALLIISFLGANSNPSSSMSISAASGIFSGVVSGMGTAITRGLGGSASTAGGIAIVSSIVFVVYAIVILFATAISIFVGNVMQVGKCRYMTMCRYGEVDLGQLFFSFRNGQYWNTVKVMFFRDLQVFLWSLLFIIPGIIKAFEYWMVPYIIAENPNISKERALEISSRTTNGEKWNIFVLGLSFIGWHLLGTFAGCGIGNVFVTPYVEATYAELYGALRYKAVMTGLCSRDEIGYELFSPY